MRTIAGEIKIEGEKFKKLQKEIRNVKELKEKIEEVLQGSITEVMAVILGGAISLRASDIHLEPEEKKVKLRMRVDGLLHDIIFLNPQEEKPLLSRIKLLSGIKLNVTSRPQDGSFEIITGENKIEVRVSTLPSEYGESVVMRTLDPRNLIEIEDLGLRKDMLPILKREIKKPNGMIIVTGPTGSGKTTTLYAILKRIRNPEIKIITIEDPIEYHLEGISQTQVHPKKGYTFSNGLRAIVRQDPDVILVGEIRDLETAKIAIQAALTGHSVLTTLHTNDSTGTIARLQALGEKAINIAPAMNIAIAQRLVRKVCKKCVKFSPPTDEEIKILKKELSSLPKGIKIPKIDKNLKIPRPQGCKFCNFTGYKGRIGIYEFFVADDDVKNFILKSPSITDLKKFVIKKGMIPLRKDGLIKVISQITTFEEVNRVTAPPK
ncbi:type II/IV secretion system protein [bacterium]|nr:type II/IV secretion system protein [bacterium]